MSFLEASPFSEADHTHMSTALKLARHAYDMGEVPVGAVVVRGGEQIGEGWNQPIVRHDPSAHAEIVALRAACEHLGNYRLPATTLYVTIEPCTMCLGALMHARVERVVFGAQEPKAGALYSQQKLHEAAFWNHTLLVEGGLYQDEATALMQTFFAERRRKR